MTDKLLPCPFCGSEPAPYWNGVGCANHDCIISGLHLDFDKWNTRAAPRQPEGDDLDQRMKAAGMFSIAELLAGSPLDAFTKHAGVNDMATFAEWLEMRRGECIRMNARYDLGERDKGDDLYDWTISQLAVFSEVHVNFKAANADAQRAIAELREECERLRKDVGAEMFLTLTGEITTLRQQRDKLAGLLREVGDWIDRTSFHGTDAVDLMQRIDAALTEVK